LGCRFALFRQGKSREKHDIRLFDMEFLFAQQLRLSLTAMPRGQARKLRRLTQMQATKRCYNACKHENRIETLGGHELFSVALDFYFGSFTLFT
jgi:hypothetical protein